MCFLWFNISNRGARQAMKEKSYVVKQSKDGVVILPRLSSDDRSEIKLMALNELRAKLYDELKAEYRVMLVEAVRSEIMRLKGRGQL